MEAKYKISEEDYVSANRLYGKVTSGIALFYSIGLLILVALFIFGAPEIKVGAAGGLIGSLVVVLAGKYIISPIVAKRHYRNYKAIHDEFTVQLLESGVKFVSSTGEGKVGWDSILKWRQNKEFILIYPMPRLYHIVPKSISNSGFDINELINRLESHVGKSA